MAIIFNKKMIIHNFIGIVKTIDIAAANVYIG